MDATTTRVRRIGRPLAAVGALLFLIALGSCGTSGGSGPTTTYNGRWEGATSSGGPITFQVASDRVNDLVFKHIENGCTWTMTWDQEGGLAIEEGRFQYKHDILGQHTFFEGRFTSATTAEGTYTFLGLASPVCVSQGQGSFSAHWVY